MAHALMVEAGRETRRDADPDRALVERVCRAIEEGPLRPSLAELAEQVGLSPHHLQRTFKRLVGVSPRQYAEAHRLKALKRQLKEGEPVAGALYGAGFGSTSRLYESADLRLGMTPAVYRKGGRGERIAFTVASTPLGRLLVAATERGVSAIKFGTSEAALERQLREEFPEAEVARDDAALAERVSELLALIAGTASATTATTIPLDIRVTAFQSRVYSELVRIPAGETRSYAEVARAIGQPNAARAVARACATNPVAVVIPCHRVVGSNGRLTGYRWGLERKETLLRKEGAKGT